ncbi:MAG: flagellar biosynthesis protein FlhB [Oscillospiraceae bacterium]|nr:flagellar biosynthesis protein FlhB [Oscillospiraceae bacterium]
MTGDQGEKTEKATPHKRREARKKGQVLKSAEINTAILTLVMFGVLYFFGGSMMDDVRGMATFSLGDAIASAGRPTANDAHLLVVSSLLTIIRIALPLLLTAIVMGVGVNLLQVGFLYSTETIKPQFSKINPLQGLKRLFSIRSLVEMLKAVLKISIVGVVVYLEFVRGFEGFPGMVEEDIAQAGAHLASTIFAMAFKAVLALFAIGVADYFYQWWEYEKNLKMTKHEVKQEYKMQEGDPQIRAKRRQRQREMSMMRMMQSLPKADVVITNPTHYAVALRYHEEEAPEPVVVAKGKDYVAQKLKEKARELGVEIVENKPVAQALFLACEVGDRIPEEMFAAVAEILARVYRAKNPGPAAP